MRKALFYKKLGKKNVQCQNCSHLCVISPGKRGLCGVRENIKGELYSLVYGKAIACHIDPIEKKPLFHFLPGSYSLSIATVGCSFSCANCQNYDISQSPKPNSPIYGEKLLPKEIVNFALKNNLPSISYTYTEPTVFLEYALETMKLAKKNGLKNVWVSNGFMTAESAKTVIPYLDANNIDLKSFSDDFYNKNCGGRLQPVLDTLKLMKKSGVWVEVTTLAIPVLNDSETMFKQIAEFIYHELGPETPWHISRFSGEISWKLKNLPDTPVETIERGYQIGKKTGLKYVYTGNIPGLPSEDTFCPRCNTLVIDRTNYAIQRYDHNGRCANCNEFLDIIE